MKDFRIILAFVCAITLSASVDFVSHAIADSSTTDPTAVPAATTTAIENILTFISPTTDTTTLADPSTNGSDSSTTTTNSNSTTTPDGTTITSIDVSPDSIPGSAPAPVAPAPLTLTPFPDLVVFSTSTPADAPPVRFSAIGFVSDMQIVSMTIVNATTSEGAVGSYTLDISNVQNVEDDNYNSLLLSGVSVGDKVIVQGTLYRGVVSVDRIITFGNPDATVTPPAPVADVPTVTTTPDTSDTSTSTDATSTDATATTTGTTTSTDVTVLVPNASSSDQSGTPDATVPPTN